MAYVDYHLIYVAYVSKPQSPPSPAAYHQNRPLLAYPGRSTAWWLPPPPTYQQITATSIISCTHVFGRPAPLLPRLKDPRFPTLSLPAAAVQIFGVKLEGEVDSVASESNGRADRTRCEEPVYDCCQYSNLQLVAMRRLNSFCSISTRQLYFFCSVSSHSEGNLAIDVFLCP
jgi:hypothetical protein